MRCKSGDLAITVGMVEPANNGVIVEVLNIVQMFADGPLWHVRHRVPMRVGYGPNIGTWANEGDIHDCNLRPISGVPVDDEVSIEALA